ncbi:hypothetical protein ACJRO7_018633 [Eucalyptus globulus]|uniref:Haloacid dehalogenase-like hydrolase domain-containing protein Sgpp n=1 Tax=Eucalyptus globulus TaxID=34317 RepID=A0ABD3KVU1_EUCGL
MTVSNARGDLSESIASLAALAPLETILFDIDGTLCDSDILHYHAYREMLQEIGFNGGVPITEEFFAENISGLHNEDVAAFLFPDDVPRGRQIAEDKEAVFRKLASEQLAPVSGLYKLKKWVEDRGLKRAAVTNAPRANAELIISILGLSDFFEALVVGSECEHAKPHPEPYLKALDLLKASKEHTIIFEDSVSGIKAGVAAGVATIGVMTRNPEHQLREEKPIFLIKNYDDPKLWAALEALEKMDA